MKTDRKHKPLTIFFYSQKQNNGNSPLAIAAWIIENLPLQILNFGYLALTKLNWDNKN
jgi:hypothetical protein